MRAVVQRVREASVDVGGKRIAEIGPGLLVFLGIGKEDTEADQAYLVRKIATLRICSHGSEQDAVSVTEAEGDVLVVSQFTLYGDCRKGRRPSFSGAMEPKRAAQMVASFCERLAEHGVSVQQGQFGASMDVRLLNDGPVTLLLDSQKPES